MGKIKKLKVKGIADPLIFGVDADNVDFSDGSNLTTKLNTISDKVNNITTETYTTLNLPAANWGGEGPYTQSFTSPLVKATTKVDLYPDDVTLIKLFEMNVATIYVKNIDGAPVVVCIGDKPTQDLTMGISFTDMEVQA